MNVNLNSVGSVIAIVVLIICVILAIVGQGLLTPLLIIGLIGAMAVARLT